MKIIIAWLHATSKSRLLATRLSFLVLLCLANTSYAETHHPQAFLKNIAGTRHQGQAIAEHVCLVCHATQPEIQVGAPRLGVKAEWSPRLKQGWESMMEHLNNGIGAMPPRGGCFECSDEQLKAATEYLIHTK